MFVQLFTEMLQVVGGLIVFYFVYVYYTKQNDKPATDTPSMAQTALRELVERAVDEARKLPGLSESVSTTTQVDVNIEEQSYENLLATAILNKVIEKYQKEHVDGNSNVVYEKSSRKCKHVKNKSNDSINEDDDSSSLESSMSHDECSSDCSGNRMRKRHLRQDSLSLTIEEQIEEITTLYTSDDDPGCMKTNILNFQCARRVPFPEFGMDIVDPSQESSDENHDEIDGSAHVDHVTPVESWEENWLFQKKKISIQSDPVSMLVPNPNEDYRALIGDKDAEDTSDLSEFSAHSDDEVEDEMIEAINCAISNSSEVENITSAVNVDEKIMIQDDENCNKSGNIKYIATEKICSPSHVQNTWDISITEDMNESHESIINATSNDNSFIPVLIEEIKNCEDDDNTSNFGIDEIELTSSNNLKNRKTPRTPASSPNRNSFCENNPSSINTCDVNELNEKLGSIDRNLGEPAEIVRESNADPTSSETRVTSDFLEQEKIHESNLQLSSPPRPGTIAEREHKKWENAPPIQNNPYSQENIEKRLLERQYSRRPSDVNGNSAVLPATPCPSMQIVIGANRPDIRRFGRDYYINESKSPTGEKLLQSGTSISSRPSSSLSHRSNSTSSDFEQQVSHGLNKLEESSLRGSLHRRTYRGANVTSHFVTNPLIHMDNNDENTLSMFETNPNGNWAFSKSTEMQPFDIQQDDWDGVTNWNAKNWLNNSHTNSEIYFENTFLHSTINPLFDEENELPRQSIENAIVDRDSGMYSIDSNEFESLKINHANKNNKGDNDDAIKLRYDENIDGGMGESQLYTSNGRKYWTLNSQKFHTFGGIRRRRSNTGIDDDLDADNDDLPDASSIKIDTNFSKFKFQTFGGIKYRKTKDRMAIAACGTSRARPSIKSFIKFPKHSLQYNHRYSSIVREPSLERAMIDDRENLKLEPPLVPIIIEKKFTSLIDLRKQRGDNTKRFSHSERNRTNK